MNKPLHLNHCRAELAESGEPGINAEIIANSNYMTDRVTAEFLGKDHHHKYGVVPIPTQIKLSAGGIRIAVSNSWLATYLVLATFHGGIESIRRGRPIQAMDGFSLFYKAWIEYKKDASVLNMMRLGILYHMFQDSFAHNGFYPWWHPHNENPLTKHNRFKFWKKIPPCVLHAEYFSEPDSIVGFGRNDSGESVPNRPKFVQCSEVLSKVFGNRTNQATRIIRSVSSDEDLATWSDDLYTEATRQEPLDFQPIEFENDTWPLFCQAAREIWACVGK